MPLDSNFPTDTFIYSDIECNELARKLVFESEVDCSFISIQKDSEITATVSEITAFLMEHPGERVLVETEERVARVLCAMSGKSKWNFIAFVNLKSDLSPPATRPWAVSVTPERNTVENYLMAFLGFCLYD